MIKEKNVKIKKVGKEWISTEINGDKLSIAHHSINSALNSMKARTPKAVEFDITIRYLS